MCSTTKSHRYTKGKRVTYTTMTGTDGKTTWFSTYRATAYKSNTARAWIVDMTNDCVKIAANFVTDLPHGVAAMVAYCLTTSKKYESTAAPAWDWTAEVARVS